MLLIVRWPLESSSVVVETERRVDMDWKSSERILRPVRQRQAAKDGAGILFFREAGSHADQGQQEKRG